MSKNRSSQKNRYAVYNSRNRSRYVEGNTALQMELHEQWERKPAKNPHPEVRKNREKAHHMNAGYVLFLAAALCTAALVLVNYIQIQADLTILNKTITSKQSELNHLKMSNDEEYNRIVNSVDLEEIKRIAMGELGMVYAQDEQIITYEDQSRDYMRQVSGH